jgi:hypothetical protein
MTTNHHAYLVRIWRPDASVPWRILVETIPTNERKGIRDWQELVQVLRRDVPALPTSTHEANQEPHA